VLTRDTQEDYTNINSLGRLDKYTYSGGECMEVFGELRIPISIKLPTSTSEPLQLARMLVNDYNLHMPNLKLSTINGLSITVSVHDHSIEWIEIM
jgi:hypothetical protein